MRSHRLEGRKREERVGELQNVAGHKRGLTNWRGGRGRSGLVSFKTWHVINKDSPTGGEEGGKPGWQISKLAAPKKRIHYLVGGKGKNGLGNFQKLKDKKKDHTT